MTTSSGTFAETELFHQLELAHKQIEVGAVYAHYRNRTLYKVINLTIIEATQEVGVLYEKESGSFPLIPWIRPISSFLEKVLVENTLVNRFQKI